MAARIVCIEDEIEMTELIRLILMRRGIEVIGANGGREGLTKVLALQPDLVLLDLMMPDPDGWVVYDQLTADEKTQHIPIVIVTAKTTNRDRLLAVRNTNFHDYLFKPFGPGQLMDIVERTLARGRETAPPNP